MARPRTLIAHHHRLFLAGLELFLHEAFEIVFTTTDFAVVLDAVRKYRPALVVQSLHKEASVGLKLITDIRDVNPATAVAVIGRSDDPQMASEALRRGAGAYILTTSTESELLEGLHAAVAQRVFVAPELIGRFMQSLATTTTDRQGDALTSRQLAVVRLLAAGKSMKEVATELDLSARTVAFHKYSIMRKLNIATTAELVQFAVKRGLV